LKLSCATRVNMSILRPSRLLKLFKNLHLFLQIDVAEVEGLIVEVIVVIGVEIVRIFVVASLSLVTER
jgi:hypothetical protein